MSLAYVVNNNINAECKTIRGALALKYHAINPALKTFTLQLAASICLSALCISIKVEAADHACTDCHNSTTPSANDLIKPLSTLCASCHAERIAAGEHVVDIPVISPNNTLPLHNGAMTCATCHNPHQPLAALRMVDPELCEQCHSR
jgi:predicted CXXCH cytochrome family protein